MKRLSASLIVLLRLLAPVPVTSEDVGEKTVLDNERVAVQPARVLVVLLKER